MTTWNYRIVAHQDGYYGLHEVFYNQLGEPCGMTQKEVSFGSDFADAASGVTPKDDIVASLERALVDARTRPVFVPPSKWAPSDVASFIG
jgi:hypothetical protein